MGMVNVLLASYVFIYQRTKDREDKIEAAIQTEQNLRLQWFKELVVQPNQDFIISFYNLLADKIPIIVNCSIEDQYRVSDEIKSAFYGLRRRFIDLLVVVDPSFHNKVDENIKGLLDELTHAIFDESNLPNDAFIKHLESKIAESNQKLIGEIYNFKGTIPSQPAVLQTP